MNILICEDSKMASKTLTVVLEKEGYTTNTAEEGKKAIELLQQNEYDLVIVDIHLPFHSGLEIVTYLRFDLKKKTPVLILTAFSDPQIQKKARGLGISGYIVKPFNPTTLIQTIWDILKN